MLARDIMTRDPAAVTPDEPVQHAAAIMRDRDVGFVPVVGDHRARHLVGALTDRDLAVRCIAEHLTPGHRVRDVMTPAPLHTVAPDADVHAVLAAMERGQVRRIPVVYEGRLVGVIAQSDVARHLVTSEPGALAALVAPLPIA